MRRTSNYALMDKPTETESISSADEEDLFVPLYSPDRFKGLKNESECTMGMLSTENCRKFSFWVVQVIGLLIVILTLVHILQFRGGFGGRDDPKHEFCWHIFLMTLGFTYLFANSLLAFRLLPLLPKHKLKWLHLGLHSSVLLCAILGLIFVIDERETQAKAHFMSLHSWMGIAAIVLLVLQLLTGAYVYLSPQSPPTLKEFIMPWHIKIGVTIFLLGIGAIITGLKKGSSASERLLINFTGAFVIILCFLVLHLLTKESYKFSFRLK